MAYVIVLPHSPGALNSFTKNVSKQLGRPEQRYPHLCAVFSPSTSGREPDFSHLGLVFRMGEGTSDYERRLSVHHVRALAEAVPPRSLIPFLEKATATRVAEALDAREAVLPQSTATALLDALVKASPSSARVVEWFRSAQDDRRLIRSNRAAIWQYEREAANLGLAIAGIEFSFAENWHQPEHDKPFFAGVEGAEPALARLKRKSNESHLIEHDASLFPDWQEGGQYQQHIRTFIDGHRRMEVMNVNADPVESLLGVDLIYYHVNTRSMIMVQYKRLNEKRRVYADERFRSQLLRMLRVNSLSSSSKKSADWRFGSDACFFKLAKATDMDPFSDKLVDGLYLPASYAQRVLGELTPKDQTGVSLGYDNLDRWLHNTMFLDLAKEGWIGTSGISVEDVENLAAQSLEDHHSVVFAKDQTDESRRERQQRARSRAPRQRRTAGPAR
ncbi:hypothetical protein Q5530_14970 [Saccharothrix sp. BKS2]|uniref:hypothetical protein n=1 Tax=Saccharothrix sp. BKS2 TaxID=3064400 RepID=UPI0039E9E80F